MLSPREQGDPPRELPPPAHQQVALVHQGQVPRRQEGLQDALADPYSLDPPDLGDIVMNEMLPAFNLALGDSQLSRSVRQALQ